MAFLTHTNRAYSTIAGDINDTTDPVTFSVSAGHGARFPAAGTFNVSIYNPATPDTREILAITSRTVDSMTGTRAAEGTTKIAHTAGDTIQLNITSALLDAIEAEIALKMATASDAAAAVAAVAAAGFTMAENTDILMDAALSADLKYVSIKSEDGTAGEALTFGHLCYFKAGDSKWWKFDWTAEATSYPLVGFCILTAVGGGAAATRIMFEGKIRADAVFPALTVGQPVFGAATGLIQDRTAMIAAAQTGYSVRCVGHAKTADEVIVSISNDVGVVG